MAAEGLPGQGHGGPQGEADALDVVGHGHRRDEIGGDGQGLQRRAQGAAGAGPVGAAHQAHPRLPEGRGHLGQVIGAHHDIPVGDHQEVIPGPGHKLAQGADLGVEAQIFRTDDHRRSHRGWARDNSRRRASTGSSGSRTPKSTW